MKQVKFTNKINGKEETMLAGKVGEKVFAMTNNVRETNDAIRWCNTHDVGDELEWDIYKIEIINIL